MNQSVFHGMSCKLPISTKPPKHPLNELRNENTKIPLLGSTRNRTKSVHFREELEDEKEREHGFGAEKIVFLFGKGFDLSYV